MKTQSKKTKSGDRFQENQSYNCFNDRKIERTLFAFDSDKTLFLDTIINYLKSHVDFTAFNILDDQYYFQFTIKSSEEITSHLKGLPWSQLNFTDIRFLRSEKTNDDVHKLIWNQFRSAFISYGVNLVEKFNRKAVVFYKNLIPYRIKSKAESNRIRQFIHCSTMHFTPKIPLQDQKWNSYRQYTSKGEKSVARKICSIDISNIKQFEKEHVEYMHVLEKINALKKEIKEMELVLFPVQPVISIANL